MGESKIQVIQCECEKCGKKWVPNSYPPKICPQCKSAGWNEKK